MRYTILYVATALCLGGCSSVIEGTSETLSFDSNPPGATCQLVRNGETIGTVTTPGGLVVKKTKYDINATCRKDGYQDSTAFLKSDVAGATFGNIVLGGGIGWAIDSASGADNKYPEHTTVTLVPLLAGSTMPANQAPVAIPASAEARLKSLKELLDKGLITPAEYDTKRREIVSAM